MGSGGKDSRRCGRHGDGQVARAVGQTGVEGWLAVDARDASLAVVTAVLACCGSGMRGPGWLARRPRAGGRSSWWDSEWWLTVPK
jgi:hypothetical protein